MDVVGCFVENNGQFILLYRQAHKANGNKWGLPAGKVNPGETIHQAIVREIFEETGIQVLESNIQHYDSMFVRNKGHDFVYHAFSIKLSTRPEVIINPKEHTEFIWVTPRDALQMDLIHDLDERIQTYYLKE